MNWFYEMYHSNICKYRIFRDRRVSDAAEEELLVDGVCKVASEIIRQRSFVTHMPKVGKVVLADMESVREASKRASRVDYREPDSDDSDTGDADNKTPRKPVTRSAPPLSPSESGDIIKTLKSEVKRKYSVVETKSKRRSTSKHQRTHQPCKSEENATNAFMDDIDIDNMIDDFLENDTSPGTSRAALLPLAAATPPRRSGTVVPDGRVKQPSRTTLPATPRRGQDDDDVYDDISAATPPRRSATVVSDGRVKQPSRTTLPATPRRDQEYYNASSRCRHGHDHDSVDDLFNVRPRGWRPSPNLSQGVMQTSIAPSSPGASRAAVPPTSRRRHDLYDDEYDDDIAFATPAQRSASDRRPSPGASRAAVPPTSRRRHDLYDDEYDDDIAFATPAQRSASDRRPSPGASRGYNHGSFDDRQSDTRRPRLATFS
jgi:hypothetical protein